MAHAFFACYDFMELEEGKVLPPYVPEVRNAADDSHFDQFDEVDRDEGAPDDQHPMPDPSAFGAFVQLSEEDQPSEGKPATNDSVQTYGHQHAPETQLKYKSQSRACVLL